MSRSDTVLFATLVLLLASGVRADADVPPAGHAPAHEPSDSETRLQRKVLATQITQIDSQLHSERTAYEQYGLTMPIIALSVSATAHVAGLIRGVGYSQGGLYEDIDSDHEPNHPERSPKYYGVGMAGGVLTLGSIAWLWWRLHQRHEHDHKIHALQSEKQRIEQRILRLNPEVSAHSASVHLTVAF